MRFLFLAVEDELTEFLARKIIQQSQLNDIEIRVLGKQGNGSLRSNISNYMKMAAHQVVVLITDLDRVPCAPLLVKNWTDGRNLPNKLVFRVAIREAESWVLADRQGFAEFLGVRLSKLPLDPDRLEDPKRELISLARSSKKRAFRDEIIPVRGSTSRQGFGYNQALGRFVEQIWSIDRAIGHSNSLERAVRHIHRVLA